MSVVAFPTRRKNKNTGDLMKALNAKQVQEFLGISRSQLYIVREEFAFKTANNPNIVTYDKASITLWLKEQTQERGVAFINQELLEEKGLVTNREALAILKKVRKSRLEKVLDPKGWTMGNGGKQLVFSKKEVEALKKAGL